MRSRWVTGSYTPIGLEFLEREVRAVQFKRRRDGSLAVHACARVRCDKQESGHDLVSALSLCLNSASFSGRTAVISLPNNLVQTRPVSVPVDVTPDKGAVFRDALTREAASAITYDVRAALLDYLPLGACEIDGEERFSLVLVATSLEHINRYLALLRKVNVECVGVDIAPCAVSRLLRETTGTRCLVHLEEDSTEVSIENCGNLLFSRTLMTGLAHIKEELALALGVQPWEAASLLRQHSNDERSAAGEGDTFDETELKPLIWKTLDEICDPVFERLALEAKRSLDYFARHRGEIVVEETLVAGSLTPRRIFGYLRDRLNIPVAPLNAFDRVGVSDFADQDSGDTFAVSTGLALREVALC